MFQRQERVRNREETSANPYISDTYVPFIWKFVNNKSNSIPSAKYKRKNKTEKANSSFIYLV